MGRESLRSSGDSLVRSKGKPFPSHKRMDCSMKIRFGPKDLLTQLKHESTAMGSNIFFSCIRVKYASVFLVPYFQNF